MSAEGLSFREKLEIARHEITTAAIIINDVLEKKAAMPPDYDRLTLCLARLRALLDRPL